MALTHTTAVRNAIADVVVDLIDIGATDLNGDFILMTAADVEVATLALSAPAFGSSAAGIATANAVSDDAAATGGTAALFKVQDRDNLEIFRGTVTGVGGGGDIELTGGVAIGAGTTVSMSSLTYSASA